MTTEEKLYRASGDDSNRLRLSVPEFLTIGCFVAVRWWDAKANPVGWQHKIVKVKEILKDGIIDQSDRVWRKKENQNGCIHGHATLKRGNLMQFLCNQMEWEIREIHWK